MVMQPDQDTVNYRNINNPKSRGILNEIIDKNCLTDIWRLLHGGTKHYTWRQNKYKIQARSDFFLVSDNILSRIKKAHIRPGYRTDHSLICMEYKVAENIKGRGYFKFNNSLLRDAEYVSKVENIILETLSDYTPLVYNKDQISSLTAQDIILTISDQLFLETVIMNIRVYTISYASSKKKKRNLAERDIENKINEIETNIGGSYSEEIHNELTKLKSELEEIRQIKIEGIKIRARARWIEEGEKPTKYF